jgi:hypothetical protein
VPEVKKFFMMAVSELNNKLKAKEIALSSFIDPSNLEYLSTLSQETKVLLA